MSKSSTELFNLEQFNKLHHEKHKSIYQIAEHFDTYPNKVRRLAKKLGAEIRNKSEAQKIALKTGRQKHPTKGLTRDEDVKIKISESIAQVWDDMPKDEKDRRAQLAKDQWTNMTPQQKQSLQDKAHAGIKRASRFGSKLETKVLDFLVKEGHQVTFHKEHLIGNEKMHLDLLIRNLSIAVEIDGPSHFEPIWGEDKLAKSKAADAKKDGILLNSGFSIIRIRQKKDLTKKLVRDILSELGEILQSFDNSPKKPKCYMIGV